MAFQLLNFLDMTLAQTIDAQSPTMVVLDSDLPKAAKYNPIFTLAVTLVGEDSLEHEIVYITMRSGTTFSIQRGQEGTTARLWEQGTQIVASLTQAVITSVLDTPSSAASTSYAPNSILNAGNVQAALDEVGDLVTGFGKSVTKHTAPIAQLRNMLQVFDAGGNGWSSNKVSAISTDGLGGWAFGPVVPFTAPEGLDGELSAYGMMRFFLGGPDFGDIQLVITMASGGTNTISCSTPLLTNGEWQPLVFPACNSVKAGVQDKPVSAQLRCRDDGTGLMNFWVDELNIQPANRGQLRVLMFRNSDAEIYDLLENTDAFLGEIVAVISANALLNSISPLAVSYLKRAGIRIVVYFDDVLTNLTEAQIEATMFDLVRYAVENNIEYAGFLRFANSFGTPVGSTVSTHTLIAKFFNRAFVPTTGLSKGFTDELPLFSPAVSLSNQAQLETFLVSLGRESIQILWQGNFADLRLKLSQQNIRNWYGRGIPLSGVVNYVPLDRSGDVMPGKLGLEGGAKLGVAQRLELKTPTQGTFYFEALDTGVQLVHPNGTPVLRYNNADNRLYDLVARLATMADIGVGFAGLNANQFVRNANGAQFINSGATDNALALDSATNTTYLSLHHSGVRKNYLQAINNLTRLVNEAGGYLELSPTLTSFSVKTSAPGFQVPNNLGASLTDVSRHLDLWGGVFGLNVTDNTMNLVSANIIDARAPGGLRVNGLPVWHTGNFAPASYATEANSVARYNDAIARDTNKVSKTGDTMTGGLTISGINRALELIAASFVSLVLHIPGASRKFITLSPAAVLIEDQGGAQHHAFGHDGSIWTVQMGDLFTRIENRALAWANDRVANLAIRRTAEGATDVSNGAFNTPAGTVLIGLNLIGITAQHGGVDFLRWMYLQLYDPVRGWVGMQG